MSGFDLFIGIDWSGDKEKRQTGLQIAVARPGNSSPHLVLCADHRYWSRTDAVRWIVEQTAVQRCLIGADFAFAQPILPEVTMSWAEIEQFCSHQPNLYGGAFFRDRTHPYGPFVNGPWGQGAKFSARHHRLTEREASRVRGASPNCMLNGVGSSAVGFSSISGMRALVLLKRLCGSRISIWPFEAVTPEKSVMVEIFPRYFARRLGLDPAMKIDANLNAALREYGSQTHSPSLKSEDEGDALLSAAALRHLASAHLPSVDDATIRREGWIFGVPFPSPRAEP